MSAAIRIGPWSVLLAVPAVQAVAIAVALATGRANRPANLYLASLLVVLAGMLTPYIIGYAGVYDVWPWLSFAPFAVPLAVGPLLYGHLHALVTGERLPLIHLAAPAAQFLYQAVCFVQPLATKNWIDAHIQIPFLSAVTSIAVIASLAGYAVASLRLTARYRRAGIATEPARARLRRLQRLTAALAGLLIARAAFDTWSALISTLDYFDLFPFYVLLALLTAWLSVEGWRNASSPFPPLASKRDWSATGAAWRARIAAEGWWRNPDFSLDQAARRLATNTTHLSRALNAGGPGFAETVARLRAEAVAARIEASDTRDLLTIALDSGFGSKASFNRAFRARFGCAPSDYGGSDPPNRAPDAV